MMNRIADNKCFTLPVVLNLNLSQATLHFWDLGGEESLQRLWGRYYDEANVLVWAMDSQDWFALTSGEGGNGSYTGEEQEEHEVKRQESWHTLSKLKSHSQLASLPLLILFTKIDKLDSEQANQFERNIKQVVREQMNALDTAEKAELEEEMNHLDHTLQGQQQARQVWNEWQVILSSAKDGTGVDEFVEWLHTHAKRAHGK